MENVYRPRRSLRNKEEKGERGRGKNDQKLFHLFSPLWEKNRKDFFSFLGEKNKEMKDGEMASTILIG